MKRFLLHLTVFVLLMAGLLSLIAWITDSKLQKRNIGRMRVWHSMAQGRINADLLIMGSSHAHVQVSPLILAKAFPGWGVYNLGIDGYNFDMQLAQYRFYRRHNKAPRLLLLCIDYFEFGKSQWKIDRAQFLPYTYDTAIRSGLFKIGLNPAVQVLPFLKYRGEGNAVAAALRGRSPLPQDVGGPSLAGFTPRSYHWSEAAFKDNIKNGLESSPEFNKDVWSSFQSFLKDCRKENVAVCLIFTPHEYRFTSHVKGGYEYRHLIAHAVYDMADFVDFTNTPLTGDTSLFYSTTHLNSKGANAFTNGIVDSLTHRYGASLCNLK